MKDFSIRNVIREEILEEVQDSFLMEKREETETEIEESALAVGAAAGVGGLVAGVLSTYSFLKNKIRRDYVLKSFTQTTLAEPLRKLEQLERSSKVMSDKKTKREAIDALDDLHTTLTDMKVNISRYMEQFSSEYGGKEVPAKDKRKIQEFINKTLQRIEKTKKATGASNLRKLGSLI